MEVAYRLRPYAADVPEAAPDPSGPEATATRRRQTVVVGGLVLTFAGLFLVAGLLPTGTAALARALPLAAAGLLAVWAGGILLGLGSPRRGRRR